MTNRSWLSLGTAVALAAGTTVLVDAQKGRNPKEPSRIAATATFDCPLSKAACVAPGIIGDGSGYSDGEWSEGEPGATMLNATKEMNITIGAPYAITLDFQGQTPQDSQPEFSDCSLLDDPPTCFWDWATYPVVRTFTSDFMMQSNTLDPETAGETELENGLLGLDTGESSLARLNMTITVPETAPGFWRFDFNPNIPPNGGADLAIVKRINVCTWEFSAVDGERAALSILVKPPKGKQYAHREGRFEMPFVLTYHVPFLCS